MAGKEIQILSFNFNLTIKPHNIIILRPTDEIIKIGLYFSPTNKPVAPTNSKIIVSKPIFSKLNRLNSFFMWDDMK